MTWASALLVGALALPLGASDFDDDIERLAAFRHLAEDAVTLGNRARARQQCRELTDFALHLQPDPAAPLALVDALVSAGRLARRADALASARALLERGLTLLGTPGADAESASDLWWDLTSQLGHVLHDLGDTAGARELSARLAHATPDATPDADAETRLALGTLALRLGDGPGCERQLAPLLDINVLTTQADGRRINVLTTPADSPAISVLTTLADGLAVNVLTTLADAVSASGDNPRAIALLTEGLALSRATVRRGLEIRQLVELGRLQRLVGDDAGALEHFTEARDLADDMDQPLAAATAREGLARLARSRGRLDIAGKTASVAWRAFREHEAWQAALGPLELLSAVALEAGDPATAALTLGEARALIARRDLHIRDTRPAADQRSLFARLAEHEQDTTVALLAAARGAQGAPDKQVLLRDGLQHSAFWKGRGLLESAPWAGREPRALVDTLTELLGDKLLIEYAAGSERLYAYALAHGEVTLHDLGPRAPHEEAARAFSKSVAALGELDAVADLGHELYRRLLASVLDARTSRTDGSTNVTTDVGLVIVPTPELAQLPYLALVLDGQGTSKGFRELTYVLDRHTLAVTPSSFVLGALATVRPHTGAGRTLIVGDPVVSRSGQGTTRRRRLVGARHEIVALADRLARGDNRARRLLHNQADDDRAGFDVIGEQFELHAGSRAHADRLRGDLTGFSLIHLAAPTRIDPADPFGSAIMLSPAPGAARPGPLTLREILELRLDADLVVVSGSAASDELLLAGEGLLSLVLAFHQAGSRAVLATRWPVADLGDTLMTHFHELRLEGKHDLAGSLRAARLALRHSNKRHGAHVDGTMRAASASHPYFWASFVLSTGPGDG